ncbi:MAG: hypothetical protein ABSD73_12580, partial [Candidatus Bathyarchaeia archaeon]
MAGQGKGPLRVAIEDFFTTTKIGEWIAGWFKDWEEAQEEAIASTYDSLMARLDAMAKDPTQAIPKHPSPKGPGGQGEALSVLGFASEIGASAASAFVAPIMRLINYFIDKQYRTERMDPSSAIHLMFRTGLANFQYLNDLKELGWSDDRINGFITAMRPIMGEAAITELAHRGIISNDTAINYLSLLGYEQAHITEILALSEELPGIGTQVDMASKHAWSDALANLYGLDQDIPGELVEGAKKVGVSADWVKAYWRAHWNMPGLGNIYDMLHRLRPGTTPTPFTAEDANIFMGISGVPVYWRDKLIKMSYNPYSRIDVRRMYKLGILSIDDVKQNYLDQGYDDKHAQTLADFTVKLEDPNGNLKPVAARDLSITTLKDVYLKHIWTEAQVRDYLKGLAYEPDEVDT